MCVTANARDTWELEIEIAYRMTGFFQEGYDERAAVPTKG